MRILENHAYKNLAEEVSIAQALMAYEEGIATAVNDGKHITFQKEKASL